jgi:hypothetical protein
MYYEDALSVSRFRRGRRTTGTVSLHFANGSRDHLGIYRYIGTGTVSSTEIPFAFTAQVGLVHTQAPLEKFVIGGAPPLMVPTGVLSQFIAQPALSPFFTGQHLETYRLAVPFGGARLYGWAGRAYDGAGPRFERVLGAEWSTSIVAIPVLGTPAARATIGAGRWMNRRDVLRQNPLDPSVFITPSGKIQFYITTQFGDWSR